MDASFVAWYLIGLTAILVLGWPVVAWLDNRATKRLVESLKIRREVP